MRVHPLGVGRVPALEVEPQVGLVVVDPVQREGDPRAVQVAAGGAQLVEVVVVRVAAICRAPGGLFRLQLR
jgi:hypothetical protein